MDTLFEFLFFDMAHHRAEFSRRMGQPFTIPGILEGAQQHQSTTDRLGNPIQTFPMKDHVVVESNTRIRSLVIPQILNERTEGTAPTIQIDEFSRQKTGTIDELTALFTVLSENDGLWILIPRDQSHGCDRYVCFRQQDSGLSLLIGWQIKSGDSVEGWASIAAEQDKFLKSAPRHDGEVPDRQNDSHALRQTPVFVMASRNHSAEVKAAIGSRDTLYIPGGYDCWQQGDRLLMVDVQRLQQNSGLNDRQSTCGFMLVNGSVQDTALKKLQGGEQAAQISRAPPRKR